MQLYTVYMLRAYLHVALSLLTSQRIVAVARSLVGITFIVVEMYHRMAPTAMTMSSLGLVILIALLRGKFHCGMEA